MSTATLDSPPRVLVVDDDPDQLILVSSLLERAGFHVQTAIDATIGFDLAQTMEPDLVVSDVTMPEIDGFEFCNMIRAHRSLSTTPILLVSAVQKDTHAIVEGLYTGADDYLEIPYDPQVLIAKAHRLIEVSRGVEDLHKEKERLRFAIEAAGMGLWEWNVVTNRVFWSEDLERIHGLAPGEFGGTLDCFLDQVHDLDREVVRRSIARTLEEGSEHVIEYRIVWPNNLIRWVEERGSVIRNRRGKPIQMLGLCMDITGRKRAEQYLISAHGELERRVEERTAERKSLEEQLELSQKLEAVGRLAGGIAHDFNNLLTTIIGFSQLALRRLPADSPVRSNLNEITKAGDRAAALTRQLLAFSRKQVLQPRILELNSIVSELENMLRRVIGDDIVLQTSLQPDLGNIRADPSQMEQVIMNLVVNARDAMAEGGFLTIETSREELDQSYTEHYVDLVPGSYVKLAVSDTGAGMDQATQDRIFEPFFTTKDEGRGTGLGLSTVYGIVKQSGGTILIYSEVGHGTSVKIYLPIVDGGVDWMKQPSGSTELSPGKETILLVEDHEEVRKLVREVLETGGYHVLEAADPGVAVTICDGNCENIDLLITDVVMPGMSGREVANRTGALHPEMKVLYMSGYADQAVVHHGGLDEGSNFLQKPFSPNALALKVREVLDAPR
jgi:PAS domain S-box-containing protein